MNIFRSNPEDRQEVFTIVLQVSTSCHLKACFCDPYGCNTNCSSLQTSHKLRTRSNEYIITVELLSLHCLCFSLACFSGPAQYQPVPQFTCHSYYGTHTNHTSYSSNHCGFHSLRQWGFQRWMLRSSYSKSIPKCTLELLQI